MCIMCQLTNIPVSSQKCELAFTIQWIGWKIHLRSGFIEIPQSKIDKFLGYLRTIGRSSRTSKRNLEKLIGLALWLTQLWPYMRIWIRHWYYDLYSIPATHYSIDNGDWAAAFSPCGNVFFPLRQLFGLQSWTFSAAGFFPASAGFFLASDGFFPASDGIFPLPPKCIFSAAKVLLCCCKVFFLLL